MRPPAWTPSLNECNNREPLSTRKLGQELGVHHRTLLRQDDDAVGAIGWEGRKSPLDVFSRAELNRFGIKAKLLRELDSARRLGGLTDVLRVVKDHEAGRRR